MCGRIGSALSCAHGIFAAIIFSVLTGCGSGGSSKANSSVASSSSTSSNGSSVISSLSSSSSGFSLPSKISISGTLNKNAGNVTLSLNGQQQTFNGSAFVFPQKINRGETYAVTFVSESTGASCTVSNGSGTAQNDVADIIVNCAASLSILRFSYYEVLGDLTSGDFNGDGHADLALTTRTEPGHSAGSDRYFTKFLLGDGAGNFSSDNDVETIVKGGLANQRGHGSAADDFNGDGFDDYVLRNEVYLGNAAGKPTRSFVAATSPGMPLYVAKVNGDSLPDIIGMAVDNLNFFGLQTSKGDGSFNPVQVFADRLDMATLLNQLPTNFALADLNGDGKVDIVFIGYGTSLAHLRMQILYGNGDGTFNKPTGYIDLPDDLKLDEHVFFDYSKEIATGDFDGDGDIDLALTSDTSFLQIMLNDGAGNFTLGQRVNVGTQPLHIGVADFNKDGKVDLASANAKSHTVHVSYGKGDGTFGDNAGAPEGWVSVGLEKNIKIYDMVVADFDGDGAPDIAVAEDGSNPSGPGRGSVQIVFAAGL